MSQTAIPCVQAAADVPVTDDAAAADAHCWACFGLLHYLTTDACQRDIVRAFADAGYRTDAACLSVHVPHILMVRMRHVYEQVAVRGGGQIEFKDSVRALLARQLARAGITLTLELDARHDAVLLEVEPDVRVAPVDEQRMCNVAEAIARGRSKAPSHSQAQAQAQAQPGAKEARTAATTTTEKLSGWLRTIEAAEFFVRNPLTEPLPLPEHPFVFKLSRRPVFVCGRYIKNARNVSQTEFSAMGRALSEQSVHDVMDGAVRGAFGADGACELLHVTHCSCVRSPVHRSKQPAFGGREDMDVRMLGRGRPFVLVLQNARVASVCAAELARAERECEQRSDGAVVVTGLRVCGPEMVELLKEGEQSKSKTYRCVIWSSAPLTPAAVASVNGLVDLGIEQSTPLRVAHRRSVAVRKRTVHSIVLTALNQHFAVVDMRTQAGTYVKEFVHGDLGRTTPSLGTLLGGTADILQLDVLEVRLDMPGEPVTAAVSASGAPATPAVAGAATGE